MSNSDQLTINRLGAYLPQDRLRAVARGESLPDRATGSAVFADISGFTPLTEALRESLGSRHGAEELTRLLDAVFTALIADVEKYGGSVIGFAGDAITCWFDDAHGPAAPRATTSAFALQSAMRAFPQLALKICVATGPARRLAVGDPTLQLFDVLAGETVARMAAGEHLAQRGEVLVDEATARALGDALTRREWRTAATGERLAVAAHIASGEPSVPPAPGPALAAEQLRAWLPPWVYARESAGQAALFNEFRAVTCIFLRFAEIDYDADSAPAQLDTYVRWVQRVAQDAGGYLRAPSIGDKGSYLLLALGTPSAHEDDPRRALRAALALRTPPAGCASITAIQIGIASGVVWAGLCGGATRQAYDFMGDDVNLAARLMQSAAPGEILVSGHVQKATANNFVFEPRPPLPMKGKAEPLPVFAVTGERRQRAIRLQEPTYALPMVGRLAELQIIHDKLSLTLQGKAQIIGIVAEAGLGKSRLAAEAIRAAHKQGFAGYGGACQSDGIHTPYLAWKPIWSAFFDIDPAAPLRKQIRSLEGEIEDRAPERAQSLPLLGSLLNLPIPDNDFTNALEPKNRPSALRALLEDCLRSAATDEPLLIVLEDLHWIDALSYDLLEELARALSDSRVCFVLAYRPRQGARLEAPRLEALPNFTKIELTELNAVEAEQAIRAKLAQLYPARGGAVPTVLVEKLMAHAQGNPFFLEELLNFLNDRGLDPRDPADLNKIELPDSLHTLILSRIDQLSEREKMTLRVASIVGRLFSAAWLTGYYPELGELPKVKADLDQLAELDITPLDTPEPELAYLFKHIVTHEVTYASLPFATRAQWHEQLAQYLERVGAPLETIAHHYGQSHNQAKTLEFATRAGDAAFRVYATTEAIAQYSRAIEAAKLLGADPATAPLVAAHLQHLYSDRGRALELNGRYAEALANYDEMEAQARERGDRALELASLLARATLRSTPTSVSDSALGQALSEQALALASEMGDGHAKAKILRNLMLLDNFSGRLREAVQHGEESLALARELGLRDQVAFTLNDLFRPYASIGEYERARAATDEARDYWRATGDQSGLADNLSRSARIAVALGEFDRAISFAAQALQISQSIANLWGQSFSQMFVGYVYFERGDFTTTVETMQECIRLGDDAGFILAQIVTRAELGWVYGTLGAVDRGLELARAARAMAEKRVPTFRTWTLACLARLYVMAGQLDEAETAVREGYAAFTEDFAQHAWIELPLAEAELALAKGEPARAISAIDGLMPRFRQFRIRTFLSEALYLKGRALLGLDRPADAIEVLHSARAEAEALGCRRIQWQVLAALSEIEQQRGHATEAEALRATAREIVDYLAAHTPEDLRAQFLELPTVQALSGPSPSPSGRGPG